MATTSIQSASAASDPTQATTVTTSNNGVTATANDDEPLIQKPIIDAQAADEDAPPTKSPVTLQKKLSLVLPADQEPVTLPNGKPLKSILKGSTFKKAQLEELPLDRRDTAGKSIGGTNRFKIAFRDKVQNQSMISDTIWVESYKKYNAQEVEEETTICKCAIF